MGRWLIDGNNVMGSRPDGWWRDRAGAKARLAAQVADWSCRWPDPVVLVFDGADDERVRSAGGPGVVVRFAGSSRRDAADEVIRSEAGPGDTVVTADRGLIDRLAPGVAVIGPRGFLDRIDPDHPG